MKEGSSSFPQRSILTVQTTKSLEFRVDSEFSEGTPEQPSTSGEGLYCSDLHAGRYIRVGGVDDRAETSMRARLSLKGDPMCEPTPTSTLPSSKNSASGLGANACGKASMLVSLWIGYVNTDVRPAEVTGVM